MNKKKITGIFAAILICVMMFQMTVSYADEGEETLESTVENTVNENVENNVSDDNTIQNTTAATSDYDKTETIAGNDEPFLRALPLLLSLDIIDEGEANEKVVSRGLFAKVYTKITGIADDNYTSTGVYIDVPTTHEYASYIEILHQYEIMKGIGDSLFAPDEPIKMSIATTLLVNALGLKDYSKLAGSDIAVANEYKLFNNVKYNDEISGRNFSVLIYNVLFSKVTKVESYSPDGIKYSMKNAETLLYVTFGLYDFLGDIIETSTTGLWSASSLKDNCVKIRGKDETITVSCGETDIGTKLGYSVKVYLRNDDEADDYPIIVFYQVTDRNDVKEIQIADLNNSLSDISKIYYYQGTQQKYIELADVPSIIYNGVCYDDGNFDFSTLENCYGTVIAIKTSNSLKYDIIRIEAYVDCVVDTVNFNSEIVSLYDKAGNDPLIINEDDYNIINIKYQNGARATQYEIIAGMVLSVAKSSGKTGEKVLTIIISNKEIVNGALTQIDYEDNKITVGDSVYNLSACFDKSSLQLGYASILLNAFGFVADATTSADFQYGLITGAVVTDGLAGTVQVKLYTAQSTLDIVELADYVTIDGKEYKNEPDKVLDILQSQEIVTAGSISFLEDVFPVRYIMEDNGKIKELDTPVMGVNESEDSLTYMNSGSQVITNDYIIGRQTPVKKNTSLLRMWSNDYSDKEFYDDASYMKMTKVSALTLNSAYNYVAYKVDKDSSYADFVITLHGYGNSYGDFFLVVNKITKVYDDTIGGIGYCVTGIQNGVEKKVVVSEKFQEKFLEINLVQGDVIRYKTDVYGKMVGIDQSAASSKYILSDKTVKLTKIANGQTTLSNIYKYTYSTYTFNGFVYDREDGLLTVAYKDFGTISARPVDSTFTDATTLYFMLTPTIPVTIYDTSNSSVQVFSGTYDDILDYNHNRLECSRVLLRFVSGALKEIVVFNDASLFD